jgi:hypothetical protein
MNAYIYFSGLTKIYRIFWSNFEIIVLNAVTVVQHMQLFNIDIALYFLIHKFTLLIYNMSKAIQLNYLSPKIITLRPVC